MADEGAVHLQGDGLRHREVTGDVGVEDARRRFGGLDLPAALAGMLAGLGMLVVLGGIAAGAGSIGYQRYAEGGADGEQLGIGGLVAGVVVLVLSFLVGGWVAGRVARYDGVRNGLLAGGLFVALAALLAGLGAYAGDRYDVFDRFGLPQWFGEGRATTAAIATGLASLLAVLVSSALGGAWGARYHRRADAVVAGTRQGGIVAERTRSGGLVSGPGSVDVERAGEARATDRTLTARPAGEGQRR